MSPGTIGPCWVLLWVDTEIRSSYSFEVVATSCCPLSTAGSISSSEKESESQNDAQKLTLGVGHACAALLEPGGTAVRGQFLRSLFIIMSLDHCFCSRLLAHPFLLLYMPSSCLVSCWKSFGSCQGQGGSMTMLREHGGDSREKRRKNKVRRYICCTKIITL